jgi:tetratricopeptide (TPR) repeat protein
MDETRWSIMAREAEIPRGNNNRGYRPYQETTMLKRFVTFGVALLFSAGAAIATAQMGTGRVTGSVKDTNGKPIADAKVTATTGENEKALETTTGKDGKWALLGFRSGTYDFTFAADGFQPAAYKNAVKQMGRNPPMDVVLEALQMGQGSAGSAAGGKLDEANALFEQKQYQEAIAKYQELLATEPTLYQINYNIGAAYRELKDYDNAIAAFQKVLEQDGSNTASLVGMGDVLVAQGKLDDAVGYFEKAIDQTQDEVIPFNVAEIYFNKGNAAKAIEYYQKAAERKPDWPEPHLKLGFAYLNTGDMAAARASFEKVVEIAPDSPQAAAAKQTLASLPK